MNNQSNNIIGYDAQTGQPIYANQNYNNINNQPENFIAQGIQQPMSTVNQTNKNSTTKTGMNKNAIISCIFSFVALFIFWWLSFVGIGLGIRSLREIKKNNQKGKVLAIIGIVVGIIGGIYYEYFLIRSLFIN